LRFQGTCFRGHDPKWAFTPLSGDGAKAKGGRFKPIGVPALYLALTVEGLFVEMAHGFALGSSL
jgi:RES domain-containing protein